MDFSIISLGSDEAKVSTVNSDLTNFVDVECCMKILHELCLCNKVNIFLTRLYSVYKNVIAVPHFFIKRFHLAIEDLIHLRFSMVQQFLPRLPRIRARKYVYFIKKKFASSQAIYLSTVSPREKSNPKKNHAYLTDSEYFTCLWKNALTCSICHRVDIYRLVKRLTSSFW